MLLALAATKQNMHVGAWHAVRGGMRELVPLMFDGPLETGA